MKLTQVLLISGLTTLSFATFAADTTVAADEATPVVTIQPNAQHSDANHPVNAPEAPTSETLPTAVDEDETVPADAAVPATEQSAE